MRSVSKKSKKPFCKKRLINWKEFSRATKHSFPKIMKRNRSLADRVWKNYLKRILTSWTTNGATKVNSSSKISRGWGRNKWAVRMFTRNTNKSSMGWNARLNNCKLNWINLKRKSKFRKKNGRFPKKTILRR